MNGNIKDYTVPSHKGIYACIWHNNGSGSGYAGGYGYHKASAAAQAAITSSGIDLSEDIDGRGAGKSLKQLKQ